MGSMNEARTRPAEGGIRCLSQWQGLIRMPVWCCSWAGHGYLTSSHTEGVSYCTCDCRRRRDLDEEAAEGASSGEDEFYDRTAETKKRKAKAAAMVEDAASLYGRKVGLPALRYAALSALPAPSSARCLARLTISGLL